MRLDITDVNLMRWGSGPSYSLGLIGHHVVDVKYLSTEDVDRDSLDNKTQSSTNPQYSTFYPNLVQELDQSTYSGTKAILIL